MRHPKRQLSSKEPAGFRPAALFSPLTRGSTGQSEGLIRQSRCKCYYPIFSSTAWITSIASSSIRKAVSTPVLYAPVSIPIR